MRNTQYILEPPQREPLTLCGTGPIPEYKIDKQHCLSEGTCLAKKSPGQKKGPTQK